MISVSRANIGPEPLAQALYIARLFSFSRFGNIDDNDRLSLKLENQDAHGLRRFDQLSRGLRRPRLDRLNIDVGYVETPRLLYSEYDYPSISIRKR